jgi:hypothetical protein
VGDGTGPKFSELFDIYLLSYAGDAQVMAIELGRAFRIDVGAARLLLGHLPAVVKRRVEPARASQYFDVLTQLGAQVVLLPTPQSVEPEPQAPSVDAAMSSLAEAHDAEIDPEVSFVERSSVSQPSEFRAPEPAPARHEVGARAAESPQFDLSIPPSPPGLPRERPVVQHASSGPPDPFGGAVSPSMAESMRELPRLSSATVLDHASPFDTVPPPAAPAESSAGTDTRPISSLPSMASVSSAPSAPSAFPDAEAREDSWLSPRPPPGAARPEPGSGLFMAESADDFVGTARGTTQAALPVIKPLRERAPSEPPAAVVPESIPPPVRLPPPPAVPRLEPARPAVPVARSPARPSLPPPAPPQARAPTMSRRPPPVFDASAADPSVLLLDVDKVPPLPTWSMTPRQVDVDPGELASLPRIELQAAGAIAGTATGALDRGTPSKEAGAALSSLPPLASLPAPTPAPKVPSPAAEPGVGVPSPVKSGNQPPATVAASRPVPPPPPPALRGATSGAARLDAAATRDRFKLRLPAIPDGARRMLIALGLFGCAGAIFALGVRVDSSILYGNASLPAVLLHAFALYAVGAGVLGMFRS